jgi:myo-inositol-1(or 4)-monophosphatase
MHPFVNIAVKAARAAGKIMIDAVLHPSRVKIQKKSATELDFVSTVDHAAEAVIIDTITKAYSEHNIIAEESGEQNKDSEITWIIDPLDGTLNFVHGLPFFAVSIAIMNAGVIEHGVIYNPIADELFTASKGSGAKLNNQRLRVSANSKLSESLLSINNKVLNNWLQQSSDIAANLPQGRNGVITRNFGSAALHLAFVAAGRLDGYCDCQLKPWDIAAGALLVKESGGYITDFQGKADFLTSGEIIVGNPKIHQQLLASTSL